MLYLPRYNVGYINPVLIQYRKKIKKCSGTQHFAAYGSNKQRGFMQKKKIAEYKLPLGGI